MDTHSLEQPFTFTSTVRSWNSRLWLTELFGVALGSGVWKKYSHCCTGSVRRIAVPFSVEKFVNTVVTCNEILAS